MKRNSKRLLDGARRHHKAGRLAKAERDYRAALALEPNNSEALNNLGVALHGLGRLDEAIAHYQKALGLNVRLSGVINNLANAYRDQGKLDDAVGCFERIIAQEPNLAGARFELGTIRFDQRKFNLAISHFKSALKLEPRLVDAYFMMGLALQEQEKPAEAAQCYAQVLKARPEDPEACNNFACALQALGQYDQAAKLFSRTLSIKPDHVEALNNFGLNCHRQGDIAQSRAYLERALAVNPAYAEAHNNLGNVLKDIGRFDEALERYDRAIACAPDHVMAHFNRVDMRTIRAGDPELGQLEVLASISDSMSPSKASSIHFAFAKALEDVGEFARAFEHMTKGCAIKRLHMPYDEAATTKYFQRISAVFDGNALERLAGKGHSSSTPIFIVGMPRSGTTLIEQILSGHSLVQAAGEVLAFEQIITETLDSPDLPYPERITTIDPKSLHEFGDTYLGKLPILIPGKSRITDKLPGNFVNVGLIRAVFPNARIIHAVRDPLDTCVSCFSKLFREGQEFTYNLAELGRYYVSYAALMARYRSVLPNDAFIEVEYEGLIEDVEGTARRMLEYCGLPWEESCVAFSNVDRHVETASAVQVRRPLYRDSIGRWRRYANHLGPLIDELRKAMPGYPAHENLEATPELPVSMAT